MYHCLDNLLPISIFSFEMQYKHFLKLEVKLFKLLS